MSTQPSTEEKLITALGGIVSIQQYLVGLPERETIADRIMKSEQLAGFKNQTSDMIRIAVSDREIKTAIVSTGRANDPLGEAFKPQAGTGARRRVWLRDLMPQATTENAAIEMPVLTSSTNAAAPQVAGSPQYRDNVSLAESAYAWTDSFVPVETLGHTIPASIPVLEDSGTLGATLSGELLNGLQLKVEDQLLNGAATYGQLHGLIQGATAYSHPSPSLTKATDILARAIELVQLADHSPNAILLHPTTWRRIATSKATATDFTHTLGDPGLVGSPSVWGVPVLITNSIASGSFLVADLTAACVLFSRQQAAVEISRMDDMNFQKNMLTLRAVERLALVVVNSTALITGSI